MQAQNPWIIHPWIGLPFPNLDNECDTLLYSWGNDQETSLILLVHRDVLSIEVQTSPSGLNTCPFLDLCSSHRPMLRRFLVLGMHSHLQHLRILVSKYNVFIR